MNKFLEKYLKKLHDKFWKNAKKISDEFVGEITEETSHKALGEIYRKGFKGKKYK